MNLPCSTEGKVSKSIDAWERLLAEEAELEVERLKNKHSQPFSPTAFRHRYRGDQGYMGDPSEAKTRPKTFPPSSRRRTTGDRRKRSKEVLWKPGSGKKATLPESLARK
jgi:hypothetical protein